MERGVVAGGRGLVRGGLYLFKASLWWDYLLELAVNHTVNRVQQPAQPTGTQPWHDFGLLDGSAIKLYLTFSSVRWLAHKLKWCFDSTAIWCLNNNNNNKNNAVCSLLIGQGVSHITSSHFTKLALRHQQGPASSPPSIVWEWQQVWSADVSMSPAIGGVSLHLLIKSIHTAEQAQTNFGKVGLKKNVKLRQFPVLSSSWEPIQLFKCPFAFIGPNWGGGQRANKKLTEEGPLVVQGGWERVKHPGWTLDNG